MAESVVTRLNHINDRRTLILLLKSVQADLAAIQAQFNQLRTDYNSHTHVAGANPTAITAATSATALSINTGP
jgi:hypothetical protein